MIRAAVGGSELSSCFTASTWALPIRARHHSLQYLPAVHAAPLARPTFRYIFTSSRAAWPKGWRKHSRLTKPSFTSSSLEHVQATTPETDPLELPVASSSTPSPVILRDYQESAIDACLSALASGQTRIGVSSPTGSGKTTMFMNLIPRFPSLQPRSRRKYGADGRGSVLIVVSSVELAAQAEGAAHKSLGPDWTVEVEQAKRSASGIADVTIATYQSLLRGDRLAKFDPSKFKLIIVDEAHHSAAASYIRVLHYFNDQVQLPSTMEPFSTLEHGNRVPIIGFSATFSRPDQLALSMVYEKIVFHREISTMLEDGWLSPAKSTTVRADLELNTIALNYTGDFKTSALSQRVNTLTVNELIVRTYLYRASQRRSTLIFCVDLDHVANLTEAFRQAGIDARSVSSVSQPELRRRTIEGFGKGEFPVLVNCEVLTEGTDIPEIDCIILARPTRSRNLLAQMVGRGLRLSSHTGKEDCYIIDIVDSTSEGLVVSPTLLGLTHEALGIEGRDEREETKDDAEATNEGPSSINKDHARRDEQYRVTYIDEADPFSLGMQQKVVIAKISTNAWVACGKSRYILEVLNKGYMDVLPSKGDSTIFSLSYHWLEHPWYAPQRVFKRGQEFGTADSLERAIAGADKFAENKFGRDFMLQISRYAPWRRRPPSQKQLDTLKRMSGISQEGADVVQIMGKTVPVSDLTGGEVSAYLCAIKHGASRLKSKQDGQDARKEELKAEKARALAARNLPLPSSAAA